MHRAITTTITPVTWINPYIVDCRMMVPLLLLIPLSLYAPATELERAKNKLNNKKEAKTRHLFCFLALFFLILFLVFFAIVFLWIDWLALVCLLFINYNFEINIAIGYSLSIEFSPLFLFAFVFGFGFGFWARMQCCVSRLSTPPFLFSLIWIFCFLFFLACFWDWQSKNEIPFVCIVFIVSFCFCE